MLLPKDYDSEECKERIWDKVSVESPFARCCCGQCHIKTGTWIVAWVQLVFVATGLVFAGITLSDIHLLESETKWAFILHLVELVVWLLLILLLMVGLWKNNHKLIAPHLIACIVLIVATVIEMALIFIGNAFLFGLFYCALLILSLLLAAWIEWRCYRFLESPVYL